MIPFPLEKLSIRGTPFALFMSGRSKEKAPAVRSSPPVSPAGEMPGGAGSRPPEAGRRPAGLNDRWTVPGVCLFLAAMTWLVFGQTVHHEFVNYDDEAYVYENPVVQKGLTWEGFRWAFTHNVNVNWTPLTVISHMLDCQFYGLQAGGHHFTSVLLHMASVIVLFLVLKKMTTALWRSAFVAAVFAIHPLHVESVAWIAERRDVLSGLFFMLTLGAYAGYVRHRWSLGRYLTVALMLALALMSKPMVVTLPLVLLLLDYWPLKRFTQSGGRLVPWRLIVEKVPLLALSGAACVATLFAQKEAIVPLPLSVRIGNALVSYVAYLGQMIYPAGLAVLYPHPGSSLALWKIIAAFVLLLAISAWAIAAWRKRPWFLFGWLWYLGMLVPVIGLIQSGLRAHADRYTYLPQIGLYLLLTWAAAELCAGWRHRRGVLGGGSMIILMALIFCARAQTAYWRNSELLWTHTLACTSDNCVAHNDLGNALLQKGSVEEAIAHYQTALQIKPDYAVAHNNLGNALLKTGNVDEAITQYQQALQIKPDNAEFHINLGCALLQKGSMDEAITHFQKALQIKPDSVNVLNNLAWLLATCPDAHIRDGVRAVKYAGRACELTSYQQTVFVGTLAAACAEAGRFDDAIAAAQKACALASAAGEQDLLEKNQKLLALYRAHQPYHEAAEKFVPAAP
jgi:Flp pilus assembly protein TadD